jgi:hypothetical protein
MILEKLKQFRALQIFVIYTRYLLGGAFVFASLVKIQGQRFMTDISELNSAPLKSPVHLFETLYQSGLYWNFIGWAQLVSAFLLMTQRMSFLGALSFLVLILNIVFITLSYGFGNTNYITVLMLLANLMLVVWEWKKLKVLFNIWDGDYATKSDFENLKIWEICGMVLFVFTIILRELLLLFPSFFYFLGWLFGCILIGLVFLIIGIKTSNKKTKGFSK